MAVLPTKLFKKKLVFIASLVHSLEIWLKGTCLKEKNTNQLSVFLHFSHSSIKIYASINTKVHANYKTHYVDLSYATYAATRFDKNLLMENSAPVKALKLENSYFCWA